MRLTKLVCTLGPASAGLVPDLVDAGMDIARVNFSHGSDEDHARAFDVVRSAARGAGRPVAILADLSGPKVRLGELAGGSVELAAGQRFVLRRAGPPGDADGARVSHAGLATDVRPGDRILLADGAAELCVIACDDGEVTAEVVCGGSIRSRCGVNVPSERLSLPAITEKDRADLARALTLGTDFVAQSFVRGAEDVRELRSLLGDSDVHIVAKLETRTAIEDADRIMQEADAIMLARGDLGVEIAFEEIPMIQKDIVARAVSAGVPVIVATQMLESMTGSPRPTRAEASDVANAVLDGADALLLSAETAAGRYPVAAARTAARIAENAEVRRGSVNLGLRPLIDRRAQSPERPPSPEEAAAMDTRALAHATRALVESDRRVEAIACYARTGRTAGLLSAMRPRVPVFGFSHDDAVLRRLTIRNGVVPLACAKPMGTDAMIEEMDQRLADGGLVPPGSMVVMVGSVPVEKAHTNFLRVHRLRG